MQLTKGKFFILRCPFELLTEFYQFKSFVLLGKINFIDYLNSLSKIGHVTSMLRTIAFTLLSLSV